ncbi:MAG TPA: DUF1236 domain-containing protein [Pseudolabrys sp.]|nr:DUF1236 domain-containing protein [Pseudolabrys sp.]
MRKARLLSTVAATLLLVGAASAQDVKKDEAPAAQQNAPAEKIAPAQKIAPALKTERKMPQTTGQAPKEPEGGQIKGPADKDSHADKAAPMGKAGEPHAQAPADVKAKSTANEGAATKTNESAAQDKAQDHNATTGQGAAAGRANLSTQQRTKISAVFRQHKVAPTHLNVSVNVGTRVPDSVHFYPLPQEVYVIYPEWRGYDYILVGDQVLVIDPRSHEIVAILDA